jgi:hypothetical protein
MPTKPPSGDTEPLARVEQDELARVAGGSVRVVPSAKSDNSQLIQMMMQITQALSSLAQSSQKSDPMSQMLPMMLAMGGKKGGDPPPDQGAPPSGSAPPAGSAPPTRQA